MRRQHRKLFSFAAFAAILFSPFAMAQDEFEATSDGTINVEAQPLDAALRDFSDQTGLQLAYVATLAEDKTSNGVENAATPTDALDAILDNTGLEFQFVNDETVAIGVADEGGASDSKNLNPAPILMARNTSQTSTSTETRKTAKSGTDDAEQNVVDEIIVTGSQIRGTAAAGVNVITIDREAIELSGLATTQEILQSVPQNFGDGANEANTSVGLGAGAQNFGFASSVNLRGLGTDSTLVLLNGRRSAAGGGAGGFVDLNSIPATAIKRIEVLPDGASAIYGSDAIGGVINVILRNDYEGAETRLRYAPDTNDIDETQLSQMFGKSWNSGHILVTYEYYDRSSLRAADRDFTRSSDLTNLGGTNHDTNASNPRNISRYTGPGGNTNVQLAIPAGQDGTELTPADLLPGVTNLQNTLEGTTVLPEQTRHSVFVAASKELSNTVDLFAEARYSTRKFENRLRLSSFTQLTVPSSNAFFVDPSPLGDSTSIRIRYSYADDFGPSRRFGDVDTLSAALGATFSMSNSWALDVYGSFNTETTRSNLDRQPNTSLLAAALADSDPTTAFNPFGDGSFTNPETLAAIEGFRNLDIESELATFDVLADGELFDMAGGGAKLAIGAQFRDESLLFDELRFTSTSVPTRVPNAFDLERDVTSLFAELYLPFVTERNSRPGINNLAVSIAGRYEDYSDFGDTVNPKLGVQWSPIDSLKIRGTIGTSFRAPLLLEQAKTGSIRIFNAPDPASPTGTTTTIIKFGSHGDVLPQEGETWTAGFDIRPTSAPAFHLGVTYFETEVDDLIDFPSINIFDPLRNPVVFAPIITRCPCSDATVAPLFNDPSFSGTPIPADQVGAIVDVSLQNIAKAELSGVDLELSYNWDTEAGSFDLSFYASHLFDFKKQIANGPLVDNVDTVTNPNSLKLRSSLSWRSLGGTYASVTGSHIGDYTDTLSSPERSVSSWTTWDLRLGYDFGERKIGFLEGTNVWLSIRNVLDNDPPFVDGANGVGFDSINANPIGRFMAFQLAKVW